MVNLNPFNRTKTREAITAGHGHGVFQHEKAANGKGQTSSNFGLPDDKLPHPNKMSMYPKWNSDPQVSIAIDLLTDMIAVDYYVQMAEVDRSGKDLKPDHPNLRKIETYLKDIDFRDKYRQIQRTKFEEGFCAVVRLPDGSLKVLPSESIYFWRKPTDVEPYKVTQEYNRQVVAEWNNNEIGRDLLLFIHNEDPLHPYGRALADSIGGLVDGMEQLNVDMPKIIHRYSSPLGIWECSRDKTAIEAAVTQREVDEDIFIGNVEVDEVRHTFVEPSTQVKFLEYIDQMNFQIGQALHAPLILLLKNATEASATKMLESVALSIKGEQEQNASIIESKLFLPICGEPVPEFLHGATDEEMKEVTLDQIGALQANKTITWKQAQDLIRQKGIALIEDEEPQPDPILTNMNPNDPKKPLLNQDKAKELEMYLQVIKANYESKASKLLISEALKEGDRLIRITVERAKHEAQQISKESLGKPLNPETELHFEFIRKSLFEDFRNSLLPGLKQCVNA
jgi:hypothetical protein